MDTTMSDKLREELDVAVSVEDPNVDDIKHTNEVLQALIEQLCNEHVQRLMLDRREIGFDTDQRLAGDIAYWLISEQELWSREEADYVSRHLMMTYSYCDERVNYSIKED